MTTRSRKYFILKKAAKFITNNSETDEGQEGLYPVLIGHDNATNQPIYGYLIDANGCIHGKIRKDANPFKFSFTYKAPSFS